MLFPLFLLLHSFNFFPQLIVADLTKSVYCIDACEDYFPIPETEMRVCADFELTSSKVCGSVITCDIPKEEVLRSTNVSSDLLQSVKCCYSMTYVSHGACDNDVAPPEKGQESREKIVDKEACNCEHAMRIFTVEVIALFLFVILILVVVLLIIRETGCLTRKHQRVAQPNVCPLRVSEDGGIAHDSDSVDKLLRPV